MPEKVVQSPTETEKTGQIPEGSLLGENHLDFLRWRDLESLQSILGHRGENLVFVLDKGDVRPTRDHPHFVEALVLLEHLAEKFLAALLGEVRDEEDIVRRLVVRNVFRIDRGRAGFEAADACRRSHRFHLLRLLGGLLLGSRNEGAPGLTHEVRVRTGELDPHGFVVEGKALHRSQSFHGTADFLEDDPSLTFPRQGLLPTVNVNDVSELLKNGAQGFLETFTLQFVAQIVQVERVVWRRWRCFHFNHGVGIPGKSTVPK
jgi:hypothetical protein